MVDYNVDLKIKAIKMAKNLSDKNTSKEDFKDTVEMLYVALLCNQQITYENTHRW